MQAAIPDMCDSKHGSKVLLYLLHPNCSRYLPPHALKLLTPPVRTITSTAQTTTDGGDDKDEADKPKAEPQVMGLSKKDPELRRCALTALHR